jgi:hypothetical protein
VKDRCALAAKSSSLLLEGYYCVHCEGGSKEKREFRRLLLPDKNTPGGRKAWNSGGPNGKEIPTMLRPLSPQYEKKWYCALVEDLKIKLALDLDSSPSLERGLGLQDKPIHKVEFMVVGNSNAGRLAKAINESGFSVSKLLFRNWRVSRTSCESLAAMLAKAIKEDDPAVIVLSLLDGSTFFTKRRTAAGSSRAKRRTGISTLKGSWWCVGRIPSLTIWRQ